MKLTKQDAGRALAAYHLRPGSIEEAFDRLRSVQFDPLQPAGCNHDLVLQARVPGYKIGDWQSIAYKDRIIYDGWDKQACLIPFEGWPLRRIYHRWSGGLGRVTEQHPEAVEAVLAELTERGPLLPKEFSFQHRRDDWQGSWYGPSVTKHTLRALWHAGKVMTASRRGQHHVYDLTERVVPQPFLTSTPPSEVEAVRELVLDRHRAVGLLRPGAQSEVWSMNASGPQRREAILALVARGDLVQVDVEGLRAFATPEFLVYLDKPPLPKATFLAPLDQILWDRSMIRHLFGFDYAWEVYKPPLKRKWGYYVLPVLFRDRFVARFDVWARDGVLQIRAWHWEPEEPRSPDVTEAVAEALQRFMSYCGASEMLAPPTLEGVPKVVELASTT